MLIIEETRGEVKEYRATLYFLLNSPVNLKLL